MMVILFCLYACFCINSSKGTMNLPKNVSVQAVLAFGDSTMDPGNNNYIKALLKANFPCRISFDLPSESIRASAY
ncbi:hypothetical protein Hanom_Chr15g01411161 [Helianthus anomalus]